jgi:integrase
MSKPRTGTVYYSKAYKCYIAKTSATHPITKQRKEWKRHAETSKEAHDRLKEIGKLADRWLAAEAPESLDPARMTFEDLAKVFEKKKLTKAKYVNGRKVSGRRDLSAPTAWLNSLREYFGKKRLVALKHSDLEDFKSHLADKPVRGDEQRSVAAINRELEFLRTILNFAVTNGYLDRNPFHAAKKPIIERSHENKRERFPTFGEELALLAQCTGPREHLAAPLIVAVDSGLRRNEMLTLAITDLDFKRRVIKLRAENAKNGRAREIPMTDRARFYLRRLCEDEEIDSELVFGGLHEPKRAWETAKKLASVKNLTWHDLRHAFVSRAILAGIPPAAVLKASGHASDEWKRYLNMTPDQLRRLLTPLPGQSQDEVRRYAATVMKDLRDALHYDELERVFDLLKD